MILLLVGSLIGVTLLFSLLSAKSLGDLVGSLRTSTGDAQKYANAINMSRQAQVNFQRQVQEWKDLLIRGNDAESYDRHLKGFTEREQNVQDGLAGLKKLFAEIRMDAGPVDLLIAEHRNLGDAYRKALGSFDASDKESGKRVDRQIRGIDRMASKAMDDLATKVEQEADARLTRAKTDAEKDSRSASIVFGATAVVALLVTAGLCAKIGGDVLRTVGAEPADLVRSFGLIARGDLTAAIPLRDDDESSLAANAKLMQMRVRTMIVAIKQGVVEFASAANRADAAQTAAEAAEALKSAKKAMTALDAAADRFRI